MPTKAIVNLTELDFDNIRASLKTYFEADATFTDYNFEGAGLASLLDVLAYNTHYSAFMANMVASETFMDSASIRNSVVSISKMLGYTPASRTASSATISVVLTPSADPEPATITVPKGTKWTAPVDGVTYNFLLRNDTEFSSSDSWTKTLTIQEGELFVFTSTVNVDNPNQIFVIPNAQIDTSTLVVEVQNSASDTNSIIYSLATDYTNINATGTQYFLQEIDDFLFQIYFGDNIIGKKPSDGSLIIFEYVACNADLPNGASTFTLSDSIAGVSTAVTTTVSNAAGGAERETMNRIKLLAPRDFSAQGRAVTADDYKTRILADYPSAASVKVYGGEEASPQEFGKVFIAIKPVTGVSLSTTVKESIKNNIIQTRNVMTVRPEIIDPDYLYLVPTVTVKYNPNMTTSGAEDIKAAVITTIINYSNNYLESFDSVFHHSVLTKLIDETDPGITSSIISFSVKKIVTPSLNIVGSYEFNYNNTLYHPHSDHNATAGGIITSSSFSVLDATSTTRTVLLDEDGDGLVRLYYLSSGVRVYLNNSQGTINYSTGAVTVDNILPTAVTNTDNTISMNILFDSPDIVPLRDQLVEILDADINVTVTEDVAASTGSTRNYGGTASAGY